MKDEATFIFLERDEEYMYFKVLVNQINHGTVYIKRVIPLDPRKSGGTQT